MLTPVSFVCGSEHLFHNAEAVFERSVLWSAPIFNENKKRGYPIYRRAISISSYFPLTPYQRGSTYTKQTRTNLRLAAVAMYINVSLDKNKSINNKDDE